MPRFRLFGLLLPLLLGGCLGDYTGRVDERGPRRLEAKAPLGTPTKGIWRQVYLGSPPKPKLVGYVNTIGPGESGAILGTHWVYDDEFHVVGTVSPRGKTVRFYRGQRQHVGSYALRHALLRLFGQTKETEINLVRMPAPRG